MLYKCCGLILREDDLIEFADPRPSAYGQPCAETFLVCPICVQVPKEYKSLKNPDYKGVKRLCSQRICK